VRVVYSELHRLHMPRHDIDAGFPVDNVERPERAERILEALRTDERFTVCAPSPHGVGPIQAVHAPGLVRYLEEACRAPDVEELFPDTARHAGLREGFDSEVAEPEAPLGRLGYWCFDTGTPVMEHTYAVARQAVDVALTAAEAVLNGERAAYALCRPPGHHAGRSVFGGFCYFNNAAIAAEYLAARAGGKVAILDIDYHHGNGTQQIFYRRGDVLYVSLHADPRRAFPYFTGYADETGSGPGLGMTRNFPLGVGIADSEYLSVLDRALESVAEFGPSVTIISLGVDSYGRDPLGDFALTTRVYAQCARRIAAVEAPVVVLQEGGYYLPDLGRNVHAFLLGLG
jgi:acetoin utilization deacetylase AcuC-like enzyme